MNKNCIVPSRASAPVEYLMLYYDIVQFQEFEITNMSDSPYFLNGCNSLCNKDGRIRNELFYELLNEPDLIKPVRKMHDYKAEYTRTPNKGECQNE